MPFSPVRASIEECLPGAMRFSYHAEHWLPYPAEEIFAFFANPHNLPSLMPAWQSARIEQEDIVPPPQPAHPTAAFAAGTGTRLTLSFLPFPHSPIRLRWEAEIIEFVWNHHFCDRQLRGPFAYWQHSHFVRPVIQHGNDVTLIVDDVEYGLPGGAAGGMAHRLFLRKQIERTFAYRQAQLARIFPPIQRETHRSASQSAPL